MTNDNYVLIMNENAKYFYSEHLLGRRWYFMQDNDPKYSINLIEKLHEIIIILMFWKAHPTACTSVAMKFCK